MHYVGAGCLVQHHKYANFCQGVAAGTEAPVQGDVARHALPLAPTGVAGAILYLGQPFRQQDYLSSTWQYCVTMISE